MSRPRPIVRLAAVVLPALGLAGLWAMSDQTYHQGTEWDVPVAGYDPRDILRGHYVEFSYDWPGIDDRDTAMQPEALCLEGPPPRLVRVKAVENEAMFAACDHPLRARASDIYGWQGLMRGRLYLDQNRARVLDNALRNRDQRGIVTVRQRDDGSFTPVAIRFRPLTAAEEDERAARDAENAPPLTPPAIMTEPQAGPTE